MDRELFGLDPSSYSIAIQLFLRLLGLIYLAAYLPFLSQIKGLIGKEGILPIADYMSAVKHSFGSRRFYYLPMLLWINSSDCALLVLIGSGIFLAILLILGIYPALVLFLLYLVHLSLTNAGQDFLSFGWETFLMEITLATFLLVATTPYNGFGWIGLNLLLFRFHLEAGASKLLSRDPNWRNLTAIAYHYLTQPLPNTWAWYMHKLPLWFHKITTLFMFYVELIIPFAIFAPAEIRLFAFTQFVFLQLGIWLTGNFSYLNHLSVALCVILIHNQYLEPFLPQIVLAAPSSAAWHIVISLLGIGFLIVQLLSMAVMFYPSRSLYQVIRWISSFHIAHPHGIFAVMTTKRHEIILEGSEDGETWREYLFYYKPGDLKWRPRRVSPYQPRLDWQAWFLPFERHLFERWFQEFLARILLGSPEVLKLLKYNPFPEKPPRFIRALIYDYEFTSFEEKKRTGNWWKRRLIGEYTAPIHLRNRQ